MSRPWKLDVNGMGMLVDESFIRKNRHWVRNVTVYGPSERIPCFHTVVTLKRGGEITRQAGSFKTVRQDIQHAFGPHMEFAYVSRLGDDPEFVYRDRVSSEDWRPVMAREVLRFKEIPRETIVAL